MKQENPPTSFTFKDIPKRKRIALVLITLGVVMVGSFLGQSFFGLLLGFSSPFWYLWFLLGFVLTLILHEFLHGVGFWHYTGQAKFGCRLKTPLGPVLYATSQGRYIKRINYQIITLLPQLLTIVFILMMFLPMNDNTRFILLLLGLTNLAGGCADIYGVYLLGKYPRQTLFLDTVDGYRVVGSLVKS